MRQKPKLAICIPWASPFIWTETVDSIMNLERPNHWDTRYIRGHGWCPARRHIDLCEKAIEWGADYILILGADQTYPEDLIPRLLSRVENDGCEVICALVPTRGHVPGQNTGPFQPMAWRFKYNTKYREYRGMEKDGDMLELINPEDGGLQRVDFIGSGCIMFPSSDVRALAPPWFGEKYHELTWRREATMDTTFVWRLHLEAGANIWLDTTIKIGHLNVFEIDDTYQHRFSDWVEAGYGKQKSTAK